MSCRNGVGLPRGATSGPQPLRATVPYQLHRNVQPNPSTGTSGKNKMLYLTTGIRRTLSLDAIVGPYLQGHWPKERDVQQSLSKKDQSTQTPDSWSDKVQRRRVSGGHKRSASWGNAGHLQEIAKLKQQQQRPKPNAPGGRDRDCQQNNALGSLNTPGTTQARPVPIPMTPLNRLAPRLRRSVEGLNQELEGMFICQPPHQQSWIPEIPDGHRAPVPPQSCCPSSQCDSSIRALSPSSLPSSISSFTSSDDFPVELDMGSLEGAELCHLSPFVSQGDSGQSSPLLLSSSPRPNKSYCFQREPPEGCEKVRVYEETSVPRRTQPVFISSCPDPNKINFTPHGGSAFCPVSLMRPLLPSMDLLFRSLAVAPAKGYSSTGHLQVSSSGYLAPVPDCATTAI